MPIIELPREYLLSMDDKNMKIKIPESVLKQMNAKKRRSDIMKFQGALKNWKINPIEYQEKLRAERER